MFLVGVLELAGLGWMVRGLTRWAKATQRQAGLEARPLGGGPSLPLASTSQTVRAWPDRGSKARSELQVPGPGLGRTGNASSPATPLRN